MGCDISCTAGNMLQDTTLEAWDTCDSFSVDCSTRNECCRNLVIANVRTRGDILIDCGHESSS